MKNVIALTVCFFASYFQIQSQVVLSADGPGDTYELINSVFAPSYDVVEVPDCNHTAFGRHIEEIFDADLNKNVFRFIIHTDNDNDRCKTFDRQRNEIKTYDKSPDNLKAIEDEKVVYKWKMKIDADFQASPNFTHLHQLKSVGGEYSSTPMYTLTARKGTPDKLELRQTSTNDQETLKKVDLSLLKGHWVEITEKIAYGTNSYYSLEIKRIDNQAIVFEYENNSIDNWQSNAEFVRPKWGIYRSLNNVQDLRDEEVLFADFSVEEVNTLNIEALETTKETIKIYPNPTKDITYISYKDTNSFDTISIYDTLGRLIDNQKHNNNNSIKTSHLKRGTYFFVLKKDSKIVSKSVILLE